MQKKFTLLLIATLALSLLFCFSALAWAEEDQVDENTAQTTDEQAVNEEEAVAPAEEDAVAPADFEIPVPGQVLISNQALTIDGEPVQAEAYNIDGHNYFKLRDLAALLANTESKFNVTYEEPNMIVTTGEAYTQIPGDLAMTGEDKSETCVPSKQVLLADGEQVNILVYNIGGNNYFQLSGLSELLGFSVSYDELSRTMIVESAGAAAQDTDENAAGEAGETASGEAAEGE